MRYLQQHIQAIILSYDGTVPLAHFLKNYFRQHPILGSRDRKILTTLAYTRYRCGKGIGNDEWLNTLMAQWLHEKQWVNGSITEWLHENQASIPFDLQALFPFDIALSDGINKEDWLRSMLVQPALFIRIRKDKGKVIR